MKKIILFLFLIPLFVKAENISKSKITDVTVYQRGARISREAFISLKAGNNEVIISELTTSLDANSIQVRLSGNAVLLSATTRTRTLEDKQLPRQTKILNDSLLFIQDEMDWLGRQKQVYLGESKLIEVNQKLGSNDEKASVEEIIRLSEFYRSRLLDIRKKTHKIDKDIAQLNKTKTRINNRLKELQHSEKRTVGEVVINVSSKMATKVKAKITYLTYQAGWSPIYDVRAKGADKPVQLVYKANVSQTTGYKWENTNLVISTGNPTLSNDRPILNPWHINFYQPQLYQQAYKLKKEAVPAMSNMYQRSRMAEEVVEDMEFEDVPKIGYGVVQTENSFAAEYAIDVIQDIPSDGKLHLVAIKEYELNTKFTYHAIPKLNKAAFLIAKVADYGSYNLLPGQSNLFFDGMYIGQSYLNPVTTVDSMLLSLGRDEKIIIKRNQLKDLTSRQVLGGNVKETKAYEISIRNNNSYAIEMDLMDQVPVSDNKEIEVKVEDVSGAKYDEAYGSVLWKLKINAGESKKVKLVYTVKYPKDKSISGL